MRRPSGDGYGGDRIPDSLEVLVARIDERTRSTNSLLENHVTEVTHILKTHDTRLRALEVRLAWVLGAGTAAGAVAGVVAALVFRVLMGA